MLLCVQDAIIELNLRWIAEFLCSRETSPVHAQIMFHSEGREYSPRACCAHFIYCAPDADMGKLGIARRILPACRGSSREGGEVRTPEHRPPSTYSRSWRLRGCVLRQLRLAYLNLTKRQSRATYYASG